jgi:hypothetical protein
VRLRLYSSKLGTDEPNLVAIQDERLSSLPTVLVCPLRSDLAMTPLRPTLSLEGKGYVVACDLARPINRKALHPVGWAESEDSQRIIATFHRLLAR